MDHWYAHRKKRNKVANNLKHVKQSYFKSLNPSNPKSFWKATKFFTRKESRIPTLKTDEDKIVSEDGEKAATLNDFFSTPAFQHFHMMNVPNGCLPELLCTEKDVREMLLSLDTSKSTGPDRISAVMLKATANSIAKSVTMLFNKSLLLEQYQGSGNYPLLFQFQRVKI